MKHEWQSKLGDGRMKSTGNTSTGCEKMKIKPYCTQNDGDCSTCSLVSYGRDCQNVPLEGENAN